MMERTTKLDHHHASATMADTEGMLSFKTTRRTHARLLCGPSGPALIEFLYPRTKRCYLIARSAALAMLIASEDPEWRVFGVEPARMSASATK